MESTESGFTLLELTFVILIIGIIAGGIIALLPQARTEQKVIAIKEQLEKINKAIIEHVRIYGHLPCPAPLNGLPDTATFGTATDCSALTALGTVEIPGANANLNLRWGAVPTRALNLPDSYMIDPSLHRISYVVVKSLATNLTNFASFDPQGIDTFEIRDSAGNQINPANSIINPNFIAYTLVSHGDSGNGATSKDGAITATCNLSRLDSENCNADIIFVDSSYNPSTGYDNKMIWESYAHVLQESGLDTKNATSAAIAGYKKFGLFTFNAISGGASVAANWNTRDINTQKFNNLTNTVLQNNNTITLSAGEYIIHAWANSSGVEENRMRIFNVTDNVILNTGLASYSPLIDVQTTSGQYTKNIQDTAYCAAYLNTDHTVTLRFEHYTELANPTGLGRTNSEAVDQFIVEIYEK